MALLLTPRCPNCSPPAAVWRRLTWRTRVFREQLLGHVPLIGHIRRILETRPDHRAPEERFVGELEDSMRTEDAEAVLATAIEWGRYAEVFEYDYNSGVLSLE